MSKFINIGSQRLNPRHVVAINKPIWRSDDKVWAVNLTTTTPCKVWERLFPDIAGYLEAKQWYDNTLKILDVTHE